VSYLVDTNILSEVRKGPRCNPGVSAWFAGVASEEIFLSALTLGELRKGIENIRRRDEPAARALEAWLQDLVATYSGRVLPVGHAIAERWGRFNAPHPLPVLDGLLAATAKVHGLTLSCILFRIVYYHEQELK
jgi:predicted nucleic acid-binding protein